MEQTQYHVIDTRRGNVSHCFSRCWRRQFCVALYWSGVLSQQPCAR